MRSPAKTRALEFQVGMFVLLGFAAMALFSFRLTESPIFRRGIEITAYLDDAAGLFKLTKVKRAGISIGYVKDIRLARGKAKLTIVIEKGFEVPENARIVPRPMGILGDKYLEIEVPKEQEEDDPPAPAKKTSWLIDQIFPSAYAQESTPEVGEIVADSPRKVKKIRQGAVIKSADSGASVDELMKHAGDISRDVKATSKAIREMVEKNSAEVEKLLSSLTRTSTKFERILAEIDPDKMSKDLHDLSKAAGSMGRTVEHLESISAKIDRGEGTLGRLVNDPTTINELNRTLTYINHAVERSRRIVTMVDINGDYSEALGTTKSYVGLKILTRETSGYIGQIVVDPNGTSKTVVKQTRVNGGPVKTTETVTNDRSALKYSLQFLKRIDDVAFRLGLFESTGGVAVDTFFFKDRVQATLEVFDFGREDDRAHMKAYVRVPFLTYLYAQAGYDDFITKQDTPTRQRSAFAGLGMRFTDEDIKTVLLLGMP